MPEKVIILMSENVKKIYFENPNIYILDYI